MWLASHSGAGASESAMKRTGGRIDRSASAVPLQQPIGPRGEHSADLATLALHPWNAHLVIGRRLMPHPRDDGGLGALFDGNALGARHRPTAHRCRMIG